MEQLAKIRSFWENNRKLLQIVIAAVLAVCFIGSVLLAIFCGGEFASVAETSDVKGLMRLNKSSYLSSYVAGDAFSFDKEESEILLVAKDPAIDQVVKISDLAADDYGFQVNGEGEIFDEASSITMTTDITSVSVVSKVYPNLKINLPVSVISFDGFEMKSSLTLEAENAKFYLNNVLLTREEMSTQPNADKPFISSAGTTIAGGACSGGACLRNIATLSCRVEFEVACKETTDVQMNIMVCKRTTAATFGSWFTVTLDGTQVSAASSLSIPARVSGEDNYFTPYTTETITLTLYRGLNVIAFESTGTTPGNLDAILLNAATQSIAAYNGQ